MNPAAVPIVDRRLHSFGYMDMGSVQTVVLTFRSVARAKPARWIDFMLLLSHNAEHCDQSYKGALLPVLFKCDKRGRLS